MASTSSWISALRPRTLFLAVAVALCGSGMASAVDQLSAVPKFSITVCFLTIAIAVILQLLSNLANDYGDFQHGTDITGERVGPKRTMQSGAITAKEMKRAIYLTIAIACVVGLLLIVEALRFMNVWYLIAFILLGAICIIAAIKYTAGKNPYGYKGLGDLFSFTFFGPVAIVGTFFLHTHSMRSFMPWLPAIGIGALTVCILNINNMRDIENDKKSGKTTIPVRIGLTNAKRYHTALTLGAFICFIGYNILYLDQWYQWLYLIVFLFFIKILINIWQTTENRLLDPYLKLTSLGTLLLSVSFCICINI